MNKHLNKIEKLVAELCPEGVEYCEFKKVTLRTNNIKWSDVDGEEFRYIDLTSVDRITHAIVKTQTINSEIAPSRAQQIVREGDVIFGTTRPMLKRYTLIPAEYNGNICSTGFCVLRPNTDRVLPNFFFHLLGTESFYAHVEANERGASYPAITDSAVKAFRIPIPPLAIQQEIVKILDTFTTLEAELEARKKQYEYYRDELLTFGEDVEWKTLGEVAEFKYGFTDKAKDQGNARFIRITDINENGKLRDYDRKFLDLTEQNKSYLLSQGDILLARTGATYGKTMLFDENYQAIYASFLIRIRFKAKNILPSYYWHFSQSHFYWEQATKLVGGGAQPQFNANVLKVIKIPIPPLAEQERIVAILDKFDALVNDISIGLPAELNVRRKQYEYYRDKLLSFKMVSE